MLDQATSFLDHDSGKKGRGPHGSRGRVRGDMTVASRGVDDVAVARHNEARRQWDSGILGYRMGMQFCKTLKNI